MATAIEAAGDLALIAGLLLAIGCLYAVVYLLKPIVALLDFSILGVRPLHSLAVGIEHYLIGGARDAINASERLLTQLFYGVVDSLGLLIGTPVALALGIKDALVYLWHTAIRAFVAAIVNPVRTLATKAEADAQTAIRDAARDLTTAERYADARATAALRTAEGFATREADAARTSAEAYASEAVTKLRAAEDAALANSVLLWHQALTGAEHAFDSALADVRGIAVGAEKDLETLYGHLGLLGAAGLLAALPALATLVNAIATEAGLDNAECRSKVKGICGTNPAQWGKLLGGLALMAGLLDLRELVALCRLILPAGVDLVKQVA